MTGQSHEYKRHGTTTLFAALDVTTGKVVGRHYTRRRRIEFLDFINRTVAAYPDREIHVIPDNLSTNPNATCGWRAIRTCISTTPRPPAQWLNQIEIWFSILSGKSLNGASFRSVEELMAHINNFIADYNENARPFVWTKSKIHQKRLKPSFADQ